MQSLAHNPLTLRPPRRLLRVKRGRFPGLGVVSIGGFVMSSSTALLVADLRHAVDCAIEARYCDPLCSGQCYVGNACGVMDFDNEAHAAIDWLYCEVRNA